MKIELDLNQMLGFEVDEETGEPIGQKDFRNEVAHVVATTLIAEARTEVMNEVRSKIGDVVTEEIRDVVREAMAGPIQQRTPWGESKGTPQTILEMVRTSLEAFLAGTGGGHDPYGNRKPANLRQLIEEVTREVLSKELRQDIAEAKKEINKAIQQRAVKAAVEALSTGVKV
jgi:hypothetical protein